MKNLVLSMAALLAVCFFSCESSSNEEATTADTNYPKMTLEYPETKTVEQAVNRANKNKRKKERKTQYEYCNKFSFWYYIDSHCNTA